MSDTGSRQKSSVKTGRSIVGAKEQQSSRPPLARRSVSAKEDSFNYDIAFDEDASEMSTSQNQLRRRVISSLLSMKYNNKSDLFKRFSIFLRPGKRRNCMFRHFVSIQLNRGYT